MPENVELLKFAAQMSLSFWLMASEGGVSPSPSEAMLSEAGDDPIPQLPEAG